MTTPTTGALSATGRPAPIDVPVTRVAHDGSELILGAADLALDADAAAAVGHVRSFDRFLGLHGAPDQVRVSDRPVAVTIFDRSADNASFNLAEQRLKLWGPDQFVMHPAQSADIIGHELSHAVFDRLGLNRGPDPYAPTSQPIEEAWSDVVGKLYASSIGAAPLDSWKFAEGIQRAGSGRIAVRDLAQPPHSTVQASIQASLSDGVIGSDPYEMSAPVGLAASRLHQQVGTEAFGRIWMKATFDHLGPRLEGQRDAWWMLPERRSYLAAAQATADAAAALYGHDSDELSAVRQAWQSVGALDEGVERAAGLLHDQERP